VVETAGKPVKDAAARVASAGASAKKDKAASSADKKAERAAKNAAKNVRVEPCEAPACSRRAWLRRGRSSEVLSCFCFNAV
jgi:uncharacterized membrane protein YdbT with pleckstrin-like domain